MELLIAYLLTWTGTPYKWGGSDYFGIDCSGIAWKTLKAFGVYKGSKLTAQGFFDLYSNNSRWNDFRPGALVFFGKDAKSIDHMAVMVSQNQIIEARGGDHTVLTLEDAQQKGALVEVTHIKHRVDLVAVLRPVYPFDI